MEWHGPVVTETDVAALEQRIDHRLPDDYRRFLLEVNGGRLAIENTTIVLPGRGPFTIVNMLFSLNDPNESNDLLRWAMEKLSSSHSPLPSRDLLFIGYDDGGGRILLALAGEHRGTVWFENTADPRPEDANPRVEWFKRRDMKKLADSFEAFMGLLEPLEPATDVEDESAAKPT
jgi:hypothetical protein